MKWEGKHALVTGGSSGIGLECAHQLLKRGVNVTIVARSANKLQEARSELVSVSNESVVHAEVADVSFPEQIDQAVSKAQERFGPISVLICSAGMAECKTFEDTHIADFERLMRVNYLGCVYTVKSVLPGMKANGQGSIVLLSSQAGQVGIYGYTAYSPSKFALKGFAEALQMEVKPNNIQITVCYPPDTDTPQYRYENETKPSVTKQISGGSEPFKAKDVASLILGGISSKKFTVHVGLEGYALSVATIGFAPCNSVPAFLLEMILLPIFRLVTQILLLSWNGIVKKNVKIGKQE